MIDSRPPVVNIRKRHSQNRAEAAHVWVRATRRRRACVQRNYEVISILKMPPILFEELHHVLLRVPGLCLVYRALVQAVTYAMLKALFIYL